MHGSHRRRYILVHTEQIGRIVLGLERRKPSVIVAVSAAGTLFALVAEIIDIGGASEVRLPSCEKLSRPVDVSWRFGWVGPAGQDDRVVLQVTVEICGFDFAHPAVGAVQFGKENDGKRRGHCVCIIDLASMTSSAR